MLQLLGVNRVVVYKTSCSPETQRILDYYTHKGGVCCFCWSEIVSERNFKVYSDSTSTCPQYELNYENALFLVLTFVDFFNV